MPPPGHPGSEGMLGDRRIRMRFVSVVAAVESLTLTAAAALVSATSELRKTDTNMHPGKRSMAVSRPSHRETHETRNHPPDCPGFCACFSQTAIYTYQPCTTSLNVVLKPVVSPTYHYPTVIIQYCDIAFISQVAKFRSLSDFPRLYISHTKPTLWLNCVNRLSSIL